MRSSVRVRMLRAGSAALLLVAVLAANATAQTDERKVFGFITDAEATPLAFEYNQPSFGVPATPTFEVRWMHTATNSDSGPSSRALASTMWPGDLAGSAPPSLAYEQILGPVFDEIIAGSPGPLGEGLQTVADAFGGFLANAPSYPIKAESFYPQRPFKAQTDLGAGIGMRSRAGDGLAEAHATGSNAGFPGVFFSGAMNSNSFSGIRDGIAVSEAHTVMKNVSLFGGIVTVDNFQNTITASSDGVKAAIDSSITIAGLVLTYPNPNGSGPPVRVEIAQADERGVVINDSRRMTWDQARAFFEDELGPRGITIRLLENQQEVEGAAAMRGISGLEIKMDGRALAAMRDDLPEPVRNWIVSPAESPLGPLYSGLPPTAAGFLDSFVQFDQSMTFVFGNAQVNGAASPPFSIDLPPPPPIDSFPPPGVTVNPPFPQSGPPLAGAPPATGGTPSFGGAPVAVGVSGLPGGLAALAVILALAGSMGLRIYADRATKAAIAAGADCSL